VAQWWSSIAQSWPGGGLKVALWWPGDGLVVI
jgi:hypothetical protein